MPTRVTQSDGRVINMQEGVRKAIGEHYKQQFAYRAMRSTMNDIQLYLTYEGTYEKPIYKTLPDYIRDELESPISEDELKDSLRRGKNSSSPGASSFTAGWVK